MVHVIRVWSTVRVEVRSTCKKWQGKQSHGVRVLGLGFGDHATILCQLGMKLASDHRGASEEEGGLATSRGLIPVGDELVSDPRGASMDSACRDAGGVAQAQTGAGRGW